LRSIDDEQSTVRVEDAGNLVEWMNVAGRIVNRRETERANAATRGERGGDIIGRNRSSRPADAVYPHAARFERKPGIGIARKLVGAEEEPISLSPPDALGDEHHPRARAGRNGDLVRRKTQHPTDALANSIREREERLERNQGRI